jgi:hypothetical protein
VIQGSRTNEGKGIGADDTGGVERFVDGESACDERESGAPGIDTGLGAGDVRTHTHGGREKESELQSTPAELLAAEVSNQASQGTLECELCMEEVGPADRWV